MIPSWTRVATRQAAVALCLFALCPLLVCDLGGAEPPADPQIEFVRMRERAIVLSRLIRAKLPADSPALVQAQLLHGDARALTNLWLDGIKLSLTAGEDPEKATTYQARMKAAHVAAVAYLEHAEKVVLPPEAQTKLFPGAEAVLLSLGRHVWNSFSGAQKRRSEERERARQALLAEVESRKWPEFADP